MMHSFLASMRAQGSAVCDEGCLKGLDRFTFV